MAGCASSRNTPGVTLVVDTMAFDPQAIVQPQRGLRAKISSVPRSPLDRPTLDPGARYHASVNASPRCSPYDRQPVLLHEDLYGLSLHRRRYSFLFRTSRIAVFSRVRLSAIRSNARGRAPDQHDRQAIAMERDSRTSVPSICSVITWVPLYFLGQARVREGPTLQTTFTTGRRSGRSDRNPWGIALPRCTRLSCAVQ